ncbi:hypothetical protein [Tahibacter soli]|uniref:FTP domain-containing protein n=1 Tax=Tahibacter soli TaxID=2983605 RepID=A0A9X3YGG1_9GAMM|nr:hypothetical protein [Tahibacter soli]MDC8011194.1 hypothetical protein [Tahibacter soli]
MLKIRILAGALAAALTLVAPGDAVARAAHVIDQAMLVRDALTVGVGDPVVFDRADGQYRADGVPATLFSPDFSARPSTPKAMALEFLAARGATLGLDPQAVANLSVTSERLTDGIGVVRMRQQSQGLPVYGSDIVVSTASDGRVIFVANGVVTDIDTVDPVPSNAPADATRAATTHIGGNARSMHAPQLMLHVADGATRLAWRTSVESADPAIGSWAVLVDAHDGSILRAQSTTYNANGTGTVFKPDPLSSARASASDPGYGDNGNADSPQFTAQLFPVTLRDITLASGQYRLEGPYASCRALEAPSDAACPTGASSDFSVTRSALTFDAVNIYYHLDTYMRYVNVTLGITAMPTRYYSGGVRYDPHAESGADNSRYSGGNLYFGEGGVNDGQDADVIIHELGHGIHDWVTNGNLSQSQGLSEGVGDYLAQGYSRDFPNQWVATDAAYHWVFNFDGHAPGLWAGRATNWHTNHSYPGNIGSGIHQQGQYFASCSIVARDALGGMAMDKAVLVGLSMTNGSSNQKAAAQAIINAAAEQGTNVAPIAAAYNTSCNYAVTVPVSDVIFKNGFEP